jgi:hypothetical protein
VTIRTLDWLKLCCRASSVERLHLNIKGCIMPTSGGRSVGIDRSQTRTMEFCLFVFVSCTLKFGTDANNTKQFGSYLTINTLHKRLFSCVQENNSLCF